MTETTLKKQVFLACRSKFAGQNASIRQSKAIRKQLLSSNPEMNALIQKHGLEQIVKVVQTLLEARIFESAVYAKVAFPDLYSTNTARGVQREDSEKKAAQSEAKALAGLEPGSSKTAGELSTGSSVAATKVVTIPDSPAGNETLFPIYLDYNCQHHLLNSVQAALEAACFEFAESQSPDLLARKGWGCAAAVELTKWTHLMSKQPPSNDEQESIRALQAIAPGKATLLTISNIRHAAVHRLPTQAKGLRDMLAAALVLVQKLQDSTCASKLQQLATELESFTREMEGSKDLLEARLDRQLRFIDDQRAALDCQEREAIAAMYRDDVSYQKTCSAALQEKVASLFAPSVSEALVEDASDDTLGADDLDGPAALSNDNDEDSGEDFCDVDRQVASDE